MRPGESTFERQTATDKMLCSGPKRSVNTSTLLATIGRFGVQWALESRDLYARTIGVSSTFECGFIKYATALNLSASPQPSSQNSREY